VTIGVSIPRPSRRRANRQTSSFREPSGFLKEIHRRNRESGQRDRRHGGSGAHAGGRDVPALPPDALGGRSHDCPARVGSLRDSGRSGLNPYPRASESRTRRHKGKPVAFPHGTQRSSRCQIRPCEQIPYAAQQFVLEDEQLPQRATAGQEVVRPLVDPTEASNDPPREEPADSRRVGSPMP